MKNLLAKIYENMPVAMREKASQLLLAHNISIDNINRLIPQYEVILKDSKSQQNSLPGQIYCILNIAKLFKLKKEHKLSLLCYNAGIALWCKYQTIQQSNKQINFFVASKDNNVDADFAVLTEALAGVTIDSIMNETGLEPSVEHLSKHIIDFRQRLVLIRQLAKNMLDENKPGYDITKYITDEFKALFLSIINYSIENLLGNDLKDVTWVPIGFGSMARDEMCPYSDIEYGFLYAKPETAEKEIAIKAYFRKLADLVELMIINMGETEFPILTNDAIDLSRFKDNAHVLRHVIVKSTSPTPSGFSIDTAGLHPLGRQGVFELIGTVDDFITLATDEKILEEHEHLSNALKTVCPIVANTQEDLHPLVQAYQHALSEAARSNREKQALQLLKPMLDKYKPPLDDERFQERYFQIKKELYRLISMSFECVSFFMDLKKNSTQDRIDTLVERKIINEFFQEDLKDALSQILSLRIKVQLFYRDEIEHVHHPLLQIDLFNKDEYDSIYILSDVESQQIIEIFKTLIPLSKVANQFYNTNGDVSVWRTSYSIRDFTIQNSFDNISFFRLHEEITKHENLLALAPDNIEFIRYYVNKFFSQGEIESAFILIEEAIERRKNLLLSDDVLDKELSLGAMKAAVILQLNDKVDFYLNRVLAKSPTEKMQYPVIELYVDAHTLQGDWLMKQANFDDAELWYQSALIFLEKLKFPFFKLTISLSFPFDSGDVNKTCREYLVQSFISKCHPKRYSLLRKIGSLYCAKGDYEKACVIYEECLMLINIWDSSFQEVNEILLEAVEACILGEYLEKAGEYLLVALILTKDFREIGTETSVMLAVMNWVELHLERNYKIQESMIMLKSLIDYIVEYGWKLFNSDEPCYIVKTDSYILCDDAKQKSQYESTLNNTAIINNFINNCWNILQTDKIENEHRKLLYENASKLLLTTFNNRGIALESINELKSNYWSLFSTGFRFYSEEASDSKKVFLNPLLMQYLNVYKKNKRHFSGYEGVLIKKYKGLKLICDGEENEGKAKINEVANMLRPVNKYALFFEKLDRHLGIFDSVDDRSRCSIC